MTTAEAIQHIQSQKGDPSKFKIRHKGFIAWKFGELAEYKGYEAAVQYAEAAAKWADKAAEGSLLLTTYQDFLTALADEASAQKQ